MQWSQFYNNAGIDYPSAIKVDISGNVYIAGTSEGNGTGFDYATIKYSPSVGIQPISNEIPDRFSLSQNYPNPFNPSTQINFSIPKEGFVKITVFDALGREVEKLADKHMNAGNYKIDFDASKLTSGLYFYKIQTGGFTDTKKMILIK